MKVAFLPIIIGALGTVTHVSIKGRGLGNKKTSGDHPNYCITEIGQDTEKSPNADGKNSQRVTIIPRKNVIFLFDQ